MTIGYVLRRIGVFFVIIWAAATVNFVVPRLAPGDPVEVVVGRLQQQGATVANSAQMIAQYRAMFGLDDPLWLQYVKYLLALAHFQFGYSLALFPATVMDVIWSALPYTIGLLTTSTIISFVVGTLAGGLLMWRGTPRAARMFIPVLMVLAPIPYYLLAMLLLFAFAFTLHIFPSGGIAAIGRVTTGTFDLGYDVDILYHSTLPALSIVISSIGGWALGMRGMMVTVQGEDYLHLAEAKGLRGRVIFLRYALRNAMLPHFTGLAISLGHVVSGAVLVETIFTYPGVGYRLYQAITTDDFTVMQGITFFLVLSVAGAILIIDLIYPRLDPRITYSRR